MPEAGLPPGVLGVVTASRHEAENFLTHPVIKGVTFVGSTSVGRHIYRTAAANGKRVQALTEAKNHALVLEDWVLERAAQSIINSFYGVQGSRYSRFYDTDVAESITQTGAWLLKHTIAQAESREWGRRRLQERLQQLADQHSEFFPPPPTHTPKSHAAQRVRRCHPGR